jgi:hypothetical protein
MKNVYISNKYVSSAVYGDVGCLSVANIDARAGLGQGRSSLEVATEPAP